MVGKRCSMWISDEHIKTAWRANTGRPSPVFDNILVPLGDPSSPNRSKDLTELFLNF